MDRKWLELTEAKVGSEGEASTGKLTGYASVFGKVDRVGDTIVAGAYADTIDSFKSDGFISWGHDWNDPVATVDDAREDRKGLWIEATFHSHEKAQLARAITSERLLRGKSMGLSIGYRAVDWKWVTKDDQEVREISKIDLFETALVTVPADPNARVSGIKALRDAGAGLSVGEWDAVLHELKEGRVLSGRNVERLKASAGKLREILDEVETLLSDSGADKGEAPKGGEGMVAWAEFMQTRMRLGGAA